MAEESKEIKTRRTMTSATMKELCDLSCELYKTYELVQDAITKQSCNRSETGIIKAHAVILKAMLTKLHRTDITDRW